MPAMCCSGLRSSGCSRASALIEFRLRRRRNSSALNFVGDLWEQIRLMRRDRPLFLAVLGNTYFWFLGSLLFSTIVVYGPDVLHIGQTKTGYLNASWPWASALAAWLPDGSAATRSSTGLFRWAPSA